MFFVFTIHILGHSISIRVQRLKSKNRHPGRLRFLLSFKNPHKTRIKRD